MTGTKVRQVVADEIAVGTTAALPTITLDDERGNALPSAALSSVTLTLWDEVTGLIINGRSGVSVFNANGGTVGASGTLDMELSPADNPLVTPGARAEWHVALVEWTWNGGADKGRQEIAIYVVPVGVGLVAADATPLLDLLSTRIATLEAQMGARTAASVKEYGAVGDGVADDAPAIQALLTATAGVGSTYIPPGTYRLNAGLALPSNTVLVMHPRAILVRNFSGPAGWAGATLKNADNVGGNSKIVIIGGRITINDAGKTGKHIYQQKVSELWIADLAIDGVSGDWNTIFQDCSDALLHRLKIDSGTAAGTDGLHFAGGQRILVNECDIQCGDDCIALVAEPGTQAATDLTDVVISNCYLNSRAANAIKHRVSVGGTPRAIRRVAISNIVCKAVDQGLVIFDETNTGLISDIAWSNIVFDASGNLSTIPIDGAVRVAWKNVKILSPASRLEVSRATDIVLDDVEVTGVRGTAPCLKIASLGPVTNVKVRGGHYAGGTLHGIQFSATNVATDCEIDGATIENCTNNGVLVDAAVAGLAVRHIRAKGNSQFGIKVNAGATSVRLDDNDLRGNTSGGISDAAGAYRNRNRISTGAMAGRAVLVAGTVTVNTAEILAGDNVLLTRVVSGGTVGHLSVGTIVAGTSFVINSSSATDTSTVFWEIVH